MIGLQKVSISDLEWTHVTDHLLLWQILMFVPPEFVRIPVRENDVFAVNISETAGNTPTKVYIFRNQEQLQTLKK